MLCSGRAILEDRRLQRAPNRHTEKLGSAATGFAGIFQERIAEAVIPLRRPLERSLTLQRNSHQGTRVGYREWTEHESVDQRERCRAGAHRE